MPTNSLTDSKCKAAKPAEKAQKLFDGLGLHLFVSPTGAKTWRLAYRWQGKGQTISFGPYPEVTLAEARERALAARAKARDGIKPTNASAAPKAVKTLAQIYSDYWESRPELSSGYVSLALKAFDNHIDRKIGKTLITDLTRSELLDCLMAVNEKANLVRKLRMWLDNAIGRAVELGQCSQNVAASINPKRAFQREKKGNMPAVEPSGVADLMSRINGHWDERAKLLCRFQALTWVRPTEARLMPREGEVIGDLWTIPSARMKSGRDHIVPLSRQSLECIAQAEQWNHSSEWMFPAVRTHRKPAHMNSVANLIHDAGYKGKMTAHGWRSVGRTWASEQNKYPDEAIEMQLAHVEQNKTKAAYNRAKYLSERRQMLQEYADWFDLQASQS